jgi:hypothetical protein
MWHCFSDTLDARPYTSRGALVDLSKKNTAMNGAGKDEEEFDLARADAIPDLEFSREIWRAVRGPFSEMPPAHHAAFARVTARGTDD